MRKLKSNEKIIQEYEKFILIEVTCENGAKYRTTIDKWTSKDEAKVRYDIESALSKWRY